MKNKNASKWIGDVRKLGVILPKDTEWVNTQWFPSALRGGIKRMAVIIGDDIFNTMSVEEIMQKVNAVDFISQYFRNVEDGENC